MRRFCKPVKPVRFRRRAPPRKAQLAEHSTDNREAVSSILTSRTTFHAEKMSWRTRRSHKPPLGGFDSRLRNHLGGLVITGAHLACNQEVGVQFPGSPPDSP